MFVGLSTEKANDLQGDHDLIAKNLDPEFNKGLISAEVSDKKGDRDLIVEHPDPEIIKGSMSANERRDEKKECHTGEGYMIIIVNSFKYDLFITLKHVIFSYVE